MVCLCGELAVMIIHTWLEDVACESVNGILLITPLLLRYFYIKVNVILHYLWDPRVCCMTYAVMHASYISTRGGMRMCTHPFTFKDFIYLIHYRPA